MIAPFIRKTCKHAFAPLCLSTSLNYEFSQFSFCSCVFHNLLPRTREAAVVQPRPKNGNFSTQHIVTLSGPTYNMLRGFCHPVATCCDNWVLLARIWPFPNLSQQRRACSNTSQQRGQTRATFCAQQCCDMLCWNVTIVWLGPNY